MGTLHERSELPPMGPCPAGARAAWCRVASLDPHPRYPTELTYPLSGAMSATELAFWVTAAHP